MSEVSMRRRIPPKTAGEIAQELMDADSSISHYDAQLLAGDLYRSNMEEIYRLARIGEECVHEKHVEEIERLRSDLANMYRHSREQNEALDKMHLAYIAASNPGIDMDEVKRIRDQLPPR